LSTLGEKQPESRVNVEGAVPDHTPFTRGCNRASAYHTSDGECIIISGLILISVDPRR